MIQVYNTLTRQKEVFKPREEGKVSIYVCGITPYDDSHLGHALPSVIWDAIRRFMEYVGFDVTLVQNFTDVDDKVIARSLREDRPALEISGEYSERYLDAMRMLKVKPADVYPKVSEHIEDIIHVIETIIENGFAYENNGNVYYDVRKFAPYGKLSGQRVEELEAGARIDVDASKRHPSDFALWKATKPGEPSWKSPWGDGRPGWHIECSAMSLKYLGNSFDFHGGGMDLVFPHHENEIAQSEACTCQTPFARYWIHNGLLQTKNEKMSKSLGNFITIEELVARYPAEMLRFYILSSHYRSPLEYSDEKLAEAQRGWERLNNGVSDLRHYLESISADIENSERAENLLEQAAKTRERFLGAMSDDFNTGMAIGILFELLRQVNVYRNGLQRVSSQDIRALEAALEVFDELGGEILDIFTTRQGVDSGLVEDLMSLLMDLRQKARQKKDWETADTIRDRLGELGVTIEDTPAGTRWKLS